MTDKWRRERKREKHFFSNIHLVALRSRSKEISRRISFIRSVLSHLASPLLSVLSLVKRKKERNLRRMSFYSDHSRSNPPSGVPTSPIDPSDKRYIWEPYAISSPRRPVPPDEPNPRKNKQEQDRGTNRSSSSSSSSTTTTRIDRCVE